MKKIVSLFIKAYQLAISPFLGDCCRFSPSCSDYCLEALNKHSIARALWLTLKRVLRCHPWHCGGHDPVP